MFKHLHRAAVGAYWAVIVVAVLSSPAQADTLTVTQESDYYFTVDADNTETIIYGNSNRDCDTPGADPYLWLYQGDTLVTFDDDSNHGEGQCLSAKLFAVLNAGDYRLRAGYYPEQRGIGFAGGTFTLETVFTLSPTATTTTSTTTTTTSTTTTSTTTTTTTTTTTVAPTTSITTTTVAPTTSTTTTTVAVTTTAAPVTTTSSTTSTTLATTTTTLVPTTSSTSSTTTTTTTMVETSTTALTATSTPPAPPNDASDTVKAEFERQVNVYSTPGYDDYYPLDSTVSVATRRTVTAAAVVLGTVPTFAPGRRLR